MPPLFNGKSTGTAKVGQEEAVIEIVDVEDASSVTCSL